MAKSSKSHPTDSDAGVRTSESGVGRLRGFASKPSPPLSLSALRPLSRHRNQVGTRLAGKECLGALPNRIKNAAVGGTINPHSRLTRKKRGASCGASATGWRIGLILRAPCSAAARALPRKTTCGGFWYFWPQKYIKNFFLCFSMAKSSKSHPTDSDVGVRKADSGVGRLRGFASKPSPPLSLSVLRPLFRHRNQVGTRLAGKECLGALPNRIKNAANGGTINPHSRLTRKKRGRAAARPPRGGA